MKQHPIDAYCEVEKIPRAELARRAGVSPQFLADVVIGRRHLGRESAVALVQATEGALTLNDLLLPPEPGMSAA